MEEEANTRTTYTANVYGLFFILSFYSALSVLCPSSVLRWVGSARLESARLDWLGNIREHLATDGSRRRRRRRQHKDNRIHVFSFGHLQ